MKKKPNLSLGISEIVKVGNIPIVIKHDLIKSTPELYYIQSFSEQRSKSGARECRSFFHERELSAARNFP